MLKNYKSLEYIHDITWNDIFVVWRSYESYQESWKKHWMERGFNSWDEWRKKYISSLKPEEKNWKVYRMKDFSEILNFYGVPSKGWIEKCYDGKITMKLEDILEHPLVKNNDKIESMMNNFPNQTMLSGIINNGKIVLIEGMHRALALAIISKRDLNINSDVVIVLAEYNDEIPKLGKRNKKN